MIDLEFYTESVDVENPPADPYMYFATLYHERDIFLSNIPACIFKDDQNFIKTKS